MSLEIWTLAIAVVTSAACALCGSLLLVNRQAMMSEGLSHAVFPGLVIAFMVLRDYSSPLLIISAAASGLLMVWLTQWLVNTRLVDSDAALGIVFAGMFSVGILLVSRNLRDTHFHADCIIEGNLAIAPLDRLRVAGVDFGPQSWIVMLTMLIVCVGFIAVCYKELKLMLFEPLLARRFGFKPVLLQCIWLAIVSLTTVAAFNVAGAVLIVALMIAPPAAAYLLSDRLSGLLVISAAIAVVSSIAGFYLGMGLDIAPTGPIASTAGVVFLLTFALAPKRGFIAAWATRMQQRRDTIDCLLLASVASESSAGTLPEGLMDSLALAPAVVARSVSRLQTQRLVTQSGARIQLTESGAAHLRAMTPKHAI